MNLTPVGGNHVFSNLACVFISSNAIWPVGGTFPSKRPGTTQEKGGCLDTSITSRHLLARYRGSVPSTLAASSAQ